MRAVRKLWRSRDWMLIPLGGAVIVAVFIFALTRIGWLGRESEYRPPRFELSLADISYAERDSEPPSGMRLAASGYGTVVDAPAVRAAMVDPRVASGAISGLAHQDVARFIRAWPQARLLYPGAPSETLRLDLRPEDFATGGRLVLRDGCLRIVKLGWNEERLVVPFGPVDLFRDEENYLAIGALGGPAETRLRIGEPGGLLRVTPASDSQLEGVAELRALCGTAPIVLLQSVKRLPDCSDAFLAAQEERERLQRPASEADTRAAAACRERFEAERALGQPHPTPCPPTLPPPPAPPPVDSAGGDVCRHPDAAVPDTPEATP